MALLAAQAVSVTGNRIAMLAIPWFVLQTTGSAAQTGVVVAMNTCRWRTTAPIQLRARPL